MVIVKFNAILGVLTMC